MGWLKPACRPVEPFILRPTGVTGPRNRIPDDIPDDYAGFVSRRGFDRLPFHFRPITFFFDIPAIRIAMAMLCF